MLTVNKGWSCVTVTTFSIVIMLLTNKPDFCPGKEGGTSLKLTQVLLTNIRPDLKDFTGRDYYSCSGSLMTKERCFKTVA
jgi:hypothetical protein